MFGRFQRLIDNIDRLDKNVIFLDIISRDNVQKFIIDLNRFDQIFDAGVDAEGNPLPEYSPSTAFFSSDDVFTATNFNGETLSQQKEAGESWFLFASGKLYNSFVVNVDGGGFTIDNTGTVKVGKDTSVDYKLFDILGLTDESKTELTEKILPMVVQEVRKLLLS
jgi:hypothetical protein